MSRFTFKSIVLGVVVTSALSAITGDAFAACDASSGAISTNCSDLVLPQTPPGNSNYTISSETTVEADAFQSSPFFATVAVGVSGSIQSLTNDGTIDGKDRRYGVYIRDTTVSGDITNNHLITGGNRSTFRLRDSTVRGSIVNNGDIIGSQSADISDYSTFIIENSHVYGSVINNGEIINTNTQDTFTIVGSSSSNSIIEFGILNNGYIRSIGDAIYIKDWSTIKGGITNAGEISSSTKHALHIGSESALSLAVNSVDALNNLPNGKILATSSGNSNTSANIALYVWNASIGVINNEGLISNTSDGIGRAGSNTPKAVYLRDGATIGEFVNSGEISVIPDNCPDSATCGSGGAAIQIGNPTIPNLERFVSVGSLTNTGNIYSLTSVGINNLGSLTTLNNYQGITGSGGSALTYSGNLPSFYNMIVYGDRYGQLDVLSYDGTTSLTFGIYGSDPLSGIAASQLKTRRYNDVMMGISADNIDSLNNDYEQYGAYNGAAWKLMDASKRSDGGNSDDWDLVVFNFGLDMAEPQRSMLEQRQYAIRNALDYDCPQFDKDGVCVSVKGRYSSFGDYDEGAGILVVSKQLNDRTHIGAYIDQSVALNDVNGISMSHDQPMFGVFADYYEKNDGTGAQARISTGLHRAKADFNRTNVFGEAGSVSGSANVDSFGVMGKFGWGFAMGDKQVLTPYIGLSFLKASRAAYNENSGDGGLDPLSLSSYSEHRTVGTAGLKLSGPASEKLAYHLAVGVDYNLDHQVDSFDVSSAYWGDMSYVSDINPRDLRINGSAGLDYAVDANKTITIDGNMSQMDYGNLLAYSFIAGFQMGF